MITIDILRAIAVLWVFAFHVGWPGYPEKFVEFTRMGYLGVFIFFVVSGFCITLSIKRQQSSNTYTASSFLKRRFLRIYPTFWLAIIAIIATPFFTHFISGFNTGSWAFPQTSYMMLNLYDWLEIITLTRDLLSPEKGFYPPSAVFWTLAIEIQFYLFLAALSKFKVDIFTSVLITSLFSLLLIVTDTKIIDGLFAEYWVYFGMGSLGALYFSKPDTNAVKSQWLALSTQTLTLLSFALLGSYSLLKSFDAISKHIPIAYVSLCTLLIILLGKHSDEILKRNSQNKKTISALIINTFIFTGTISYSLYLLHGHILQIPMQFIRQVISPNNIAFVPLVIIATIMMSYVFHIYCERPFFRKSVRNHA